jgi:oxalate decarboxylase/phosphoglucose isomerase-like protein (cupin superfamily)
MDVFKRLMQSLQITAYHKWMKSEGIPVWEGYAIKDVRDIELRPWERMGGKGTFVHLYGMEGMTGMYVAEIPPGGALKPEKHMYEEIICILSGNGATEIWQEGGPKRMFEWGRWSVFAPPLNTWHRIVNGGREPVKLLALTTAPLIIDYYRKLDFIFNCPVVFEDRFAGEENYFGETNRRYKRGRGNVWDTNFVPDVSSAALDAEEEKGAGAKITQFNIAGNSLIGHIAHWPAGRYHKAHYHGPGAILVGIYSKGYVLLWPKELGIHPYESGHGDEVLEIEWGEGSVYCPPNAWFHQHFNTGAEPARQLALRMGTRVHSLGISHAVKRFDDGTLTSIKEGGTLIEYEDEDPAIRANFDKALKKTGVASTMPPLLRAAS